jgi:hypothetical protein
MPLFCLLINASRLALQQEALTASLASFRNGVLRQAVSLPVGAGKTTVFAHLIAQVEPPPSNPSARYAVHMHGATCMPLR